MRLSIMKLSAIVLMQFLLSLGFQATVLSQHSPATRNVLLDSIAWIPQTLPVPGVVAGTAIWFDYNDDGRLDIVMGGLSVDGPVSGIFRNDSTGFVDVQAQICSLITERGLAWGDYDNDGDYDLAIEGWTGTSQAMMSKIYRNDSGSFVDIRAPLLNLGGGPASWVDYDNDGRLDLLMTGSSDGGASFATKLYRNTQGTFIDQQVPFPGVWGSSVGWGDYDNDGDPDLLISGWGWGGRVTSLFRNDLTPDSGSVFVEITTPVFGGGTFDAVNSSALTWFDYDNDGYPDVLITGLGWSGTIAKIYHNNHGTFKDVGANLHGVTVSAVAVGDYDNDGYMDIAISGGEDFFYGSNPTTKIYHNNRDGTFTDINANLVGTWFGSVEWADYDNDGRLDLLVTGASIPRVSVSQDGRTLKPVTVLYKNVVVVDSNTTPTVPSGTAVSVAGRNATVSWNPSMDLETGQAAISYNVRIGRAPGGIDVVSPLSNVQSGFRRSPKLGNAGHRTSAKFRNLSPGRYYWSVQAVDNQYRASSFAQEGTFEITGASVGETPAAPKEYSLGQNYPNPFNPKTMISCQWPVVSDVRLAVYDILGREVAVLLNERKAPGRYEVEFDGSRLSSGVYVYRLEAGSFTAVKKLVVLR